MPNNNIISQEQKRKAINFQVAVAQGNLLNVQKYCDAYTLNCQNSKGDTALHIASKNAHNEILAFVFQQPKAQFHLRNLENKKAVELINELSTAKLWQELLIIEKNLVQATVLRQKKLLVKNYDFTLNSQNHRHKSFTLEDLSEINRYVKQTLIYGAPDWTSEQFPHQPATPASLWKKKHLDYYRIDVLQDLLSTIEYELAEFPLDPFMRLLMMPIIHSALAEVIQVGRCHDQVAVAFNQLLIKGKQASLTWMRVENLKWKPTDCLNNTKNHSFIVLDKVGGWEPETWESGLLIDPMGDNVAFLKECAAPLMEDLMRIIRQPDKAQIQLFNQLILSLPLQGKQHALIAETLEMLTLAMKGYFELNWHRYWPEMKKNYPRLKERRVKTWLEKIWDVLAKNTDIHAAIAHNLYLNEIHDSLAKLEQRVEIINCSERLAGYLNTHMHNG